MAGTVKSDATFLQLFSIFIVNTLTMGHVVKQSVTRYNLTTGTISSPIQENPLNYMIQEISGGDGNDFIRT